LPLTDAINYKEFFLNFIAGAKDFGCIEKLATSTKEFFIRIFESKIPRNDTIRERSALFISFIFKPLVIYYRQFLNEPLKFRKYPEPLKTDQIMTSVLRELMDCMLDGLQFKDICIPIATEVCHVMENYPQLFLKNLNMLSKYLLLLEMDNISMLTLAIKSLTRLFSVAERKELSHFFYFNVHSFVDEKGDNLKISIKELLFQLAMAYDQDEFDEQILQLFIQIAKLDRSTSFLSSKQRKKIYEKKIIVENTKVFGKLIEMINLYEQSPIITLINTFNTICAPDDFVEVAIAQIHINSKQFLDEVLKIIIETLDDCEKCYRACQIFRAYHKAYPVLVERKFLPMINNLLVRSISNEFVFGSFCDFLVNINHMMFIRLISNVKRAKEIISIILEAFNNFSKPRTLEKIFKLIVVSCEN
jgi:hypothetical protein